MLNVPLYGMGVIEDVGRRMGTLMVFIALGGLAGPPTSGAIWSATGGINAVSYYAGRIRSSPHFTEVTCVISGSAILLAVVLMLITRHLMLKKFWGKCRNSKSMTTLLWVLWLDHRWTRCPLFLSFVLTILLFISLIVSASLYTTT